MKPFNILPPRIDLVDKAGSVAREWWRWFNAIQEVTGGGASGTIGDLAIQAETQPPHGNDYDAAIGDTNKLIQAPSPHGTDYDMAIADLRKRLESLPRGSGASVAIRVEDLQALILSLPQRACCAYHADPLLALRSTARSDWNAGYVASISTGLTLTAGVLTSSGGGGGLPIGPLPTSDAGLAAGSYWNNSGVLCITAGGTLPTTNSGLPAGLYWNDLGVVSISSGLPTSNAGLASAEYWNNGGVVSIA